VKTMSLRIKKLILQMRNFEGIMRKILKNRKAAVGLVLLVFFAVVALIGPLFAKDDAIAVGSVPAGKLPVAYQLAYPEWYKYLLGGNYTSNIRVVSDPTFSDAGDLSLWKNGTTDPRIQINYATTIGQGDNNSVEMIFNHEGNATISIDFDYPYTVPPKLYGIEWSYHIDTPYPQTRQQANFTASIDFPYRLPTTNATRVYPAAFPYPIKVASADWVSMPWSSSTSAAPNLRQLYDLQDPLPIVFAKPRIYTLGFTVTLSRNETAYGGNLTSYANTKFYLDNIECVVYGNSFGLLGSDDIARDIFTQLVDGTRISFIIGIVSAVLSVGIGLIVGLVAGYIGGATDEVLMRLNDMLLVIPSLPLIIVLVFVLGQSMLNIIFVVGVLGWMGFARTVRSAVLTLKERSFIEAVKSAGGGRGYIIRRHIVPNVFPLIYITLAMSVPGAIVSEAALSWLGLGPLDVMSWGRILYEFEQGGASAANAFQFWYWAIPPGICIALLSLSFVLIGYALDEILNPRLRER
jgi:peptide/nickel transport system permease protein